MFPLVIVFQIDLVRAAKQSGKKGIGSRKNGTLTKVNFLPQNLSK
jgi:hypothetical protein